MKMSGHSLSVFISISAFCIFMLWFLTPIYCALFLAFTLTPVAHYVRTHLVRSTIIFSVIALGLWVSAPIAVDKAKQAGTSVIELIQNLASELPELSQPLHVSEWNLEVLQSFVATDTVYSTLQLSSGWIMEIALFCSLFFIALVTFVRRPDALIHWVPSSKKAVARNVLENAQSISYTFFRNELILITITWILSWFFLYVIHFPHAFIVGLLIALLDVIPFLGVSLFYIPVALFFYSEQQQLLGSMTLLFFFFLVFSRHLIEPLLWKQRVHLPALVVLVILSSALMLFGIKGFLLIPLCFVAVAQLQLQSSN